MVLIKIVAKTGQYGVPQEDAKGGANQITHDGLFHGTGHKADVSAAERNNPAEKNSGFSVVAKGAV